MARWIDNLRKYFPVRSRSVRTSQVQAQPAAQRPGANRAGNSSHRSYSPYPGRILARYDAVKMTGNRHRRLMDRGTEESEFIPYDRMYAISLLRDMHRNQARFVSLEKPRTFVRSCSL